MCNVPGLSPIVWKSVREKSNKLKEKQNKRKTKEKKRPKKGKKEKKRKAERFNVDFRWFITNKIASRVQQQQQRVEREGLQQQNRNGNV